MKVSIFMQEILSVVLTPFILCFSLPDCAPEIIDFFREFTVHVEDLGYVCSFAVFDFKRHGNINVSTLLCQLCSQFNFDWYSLEHPPNRQMNVTNQSKAKWKSPSSTSRFEYRFRTRVADNFATGRTS